MRSSGISSNAWEIKIRIEILIPDHFTDLQKQASEKLMEKEVKALLTPPHGHGQKNLWQNAMEDNLSSLLTSDKKFDAIVMVYPIKAFLENHFDCNHIF